MTYKLKKDHVTNWDINEPQEKSTFNDDQDSYISERSSTASLKENSPLPKSNNKPPPSFQYKQQPSPQYKQQQSPQSRQPREPHSLRYYYNDLPENGIPLATQVKEAQKEEEKRIKEVRKAPPGQGSLVPPPETKPSEIGDNYHPYWRYYKETNPDWFMRHQQGQDGLVIPYETVDPSKYVHPPNLSTPERRARRRHRKSRHNPDKKHHEIDQKESLPTFYDNSSQYIPLKDSNNEVYSEQFNTRKVKPNNDWNGHYNQSITASKSSQDLTNSKHRHHHSTKTNNILPNENKIHHHRHHHSSSQPQYSYSPPQSEQKPLPSQSSHRHHHHHHHHHQSPPQSHHHQHHRHHHYSPVKEFVDTQFHVIDASFKESKRSPYFHRPPNPFQLPPPAIYNQNSYLPPITHDYHNYPRSYPTDYYSNQTYNHDHRDSIKSPKIYKPDKQTNFYDHYLNNVITRKIA